MPAGRDRARTVDALATGTARRVLALWARVDPGNIRGSWASLSVIAESLVSLGQLAAAVGSDGYVDRAWSETHARPAPPQGRVAARSLAGVASDGRSLAGLLEQPAIGALQLIAQGGAAPDALAVQQPRLSMMAGTQVADAARAADSVAVTARPEIGGYVRVVTAPSCDRCVVLAGRWYEWSEGFLRHPRCNCQHRPANRSESDETAPRRYFDSLTREQQDRIFGVAQASSIRDGADVAGIVTARQRGGLYIAAPVTPRAGERSLKRLAEVRHQLSVLQPQLTDGTATEWTRSRIATLSDELSQLQASPQVMPEQIIAAAATRSQAIEDLTVAGYLA